MKVIDQIRNSLKKDKNYHILLLFDIYNKGLILNADIWCQSESIAQGRSYLDNNDVSHCFYSRLSLFSWNGGVIYVDGGSYSMNFNYSMFYSCACSNHGGAIFFYFTNSYIRMICAYGCSERISNQYIDRTTRETPKEIILI